MRRWSGACLAALPREPEMQMTPDWGMSWTVAAYAVSWVVLVMYARYVIARSRTAHEALGREARRTEVPS